MTRLIDCLAPDPTVASIAFELARDFQMGSTHQSLPANRVVAMQWYRIAFDHGHSTAWPCYQSVQLLDQFLQGLHVSVARSGMPSHWKTLEKAGTTLVTSLCCALDPTYQGDPGLNKALTNFEQALRLMRSAFAYQTMRYLLGGLICLLLIGTVLLSLTMLAPSVIPMLSVWIMTLSVSCQALAVGGSVLAMGAVGVGYYFFTHGVRGSGQQLLDYITQVGIDYGSNTSI